MTPANYTGRPARCAERIATRMNFTDKLRRAERANDSMLCVGLDPEPAKFPGAWKATPSASSTSARHRRRDAATS
jgi:hypothetical protein